MAGPGVALAQPCRLRQRAVPCHAAAIRRRVELPEKAAPGYFRVGCDSPLATCQGMHNTCCGHPQPPHHTPVKVWLLAPSFCLTDHLVKQGAPGSAPELAALPPLSSDKLISQVSSGVPGRGRTHRDRVPCPLPHSLGCHSAQALLQEVMPGASGGSGARQPKLSLTGRS